MLYIYTHKYIQIHTFPYVHIQIHTQHVHKNPPTHMTAFSLTLPPLTKIRTHNHPQPHPNAHLHTHALTHAREHQRRHTHTHNHMVYVLNTRTCIYGCIQALAMNTQTSGIAVCNDCTYTYSVCVIHGRRNTRCDTA